MGSADVDKVSAKLEVAVCQLTSTDDIDANLAQILGILQRLDGAKVDLVCFPENALYLRLREGEVVPAIEREHAAVKKIAAWAAHEGAVVHLGSVPYSRDGRLYNTSFLIRPDGSVNAHYNKIHLFDVDVEGHKPLRESDVFSHGEVPSIFEVKGWKFGATICYDLRFAELFLEYARAGVDTILIPAAFLVPTGRAHWHVLTRARAIESQAYVLAAAQGGVHVAAHGGRRETFGHSLVIDPWGVVMGEVSEGAGSDGAGAYIAGGGEAVSRIIRATLDKARIRQVRSQIPMAAHRRL